MLDFSKRIVVVGCGGIGSWLLAPLFRFLAAEGFKGQICLCDGDKYTESNMNRQQFPPDAINHNKADVQKVIWSAMYPMLQIVSFSEFIVKKNVDTIIREGDIVFTCVDNHPCRVLIDKHTDKFDNVVVIGAGNELFDGNAHVKLRIDGLAASESFLQRHPETEKIKEGDRTGVGCEDLIKSGSTQLLVTNFVAATCSLMAFHNLWVYGKKNPDTGKNHSFIPGEIYFDITTSKTGAVEAVEVAA